MDDTPVHPIWRCRQGRASAARPSVRRASQRYRRPRSSTAGRRGLTASVCCTKMLPPPLPSHTTASREAGAHRNGAVVSLHHPWQCQPTSGTHQRQTAPRRTHRDGSGGAAGEVGVAATTRNADPVARQAANTDEPAAAVDAALRGSPLFCAPEVGWPRCTLGSNDAVGGASTGSPEVLSDLNHRVARC